MAIERSLNMRPKTAGSGANALLCVAIRWVDCIYLAYFALVNWAILIHTMRPSLHETLDPSLFAQHRSTTVVHLLLLRFIEHTLTHTCIDCKTRYHANYYIHNNASVRMYYVGIPRQLQMATHYFIEGDLCKFFANMMMFTWYRFNPVSCSSG